MASRRIETSIPARLDRLPVGALALDRVGGFGAGRPSGPARTAVAHT
jgi:hypothetical protein